MRPASPDELGLLNLPSGATVIQLIHTAYDQGGEILEVSESVWASDRIVILDEYDIAQEPADLQGLSDI